MNHVRIDKQNKKICIKSVMISKPATIAVSVNYDNYTDHYMPVINDSCSYITYKVIDKMETSTHTVFWGEVYGGEVFSDTDMRTYLCRQQAPEVCPVCAHPQSYFQVKPENY